MIKKYTCPHLFLFLAISLCFCITPKFALADEGEVGFYRMGVFPFLPASRLEAVFAPLAGELGKEIGVPVYYSSSSTYLKFMKKLEAKHYEIAFIQPFDYLRIAKDAGYKPVAKRKEPLNGVFVVSETFDGDNLEDLKGKVVAMAPEVAALSYLGKSKLINSGLSLSNDIQIVHKRGHHECLQDVVVGKSSSLRNWKASS